MAEEVIGKTVILNQPSYAIYNIFSDFKRIESTLPQDKRDKVHFEEDSVLVKVQGFEIGAKIHNKVPFSLVELEQYGQAPFPFLVSFHMEPMSDTQTCFHIELRAELNTMMKMFIGKRLPDIVEKLTDGIAQAASGNIPDDIKQYMNGQGINFS